MILQAIPALRAVGPPTLLSSAAADWQLLAINVNECEEFTKGVDQPEAGLIGGSPTR